MGRAVWASLFFVTGITQTYAQSEVIHRQDTLDEVVVTSQSANRRVNEVQIGTEKVDVVTMSRLPAMLGERDIIKGLQLLPGVKSEADGLGGYQVRGGTSAQNNILLDGASVYNVGHLMGLFSAFNDDAIGGAELFKGLMPARYGGGSSSVLNMSTRVGDTERHHLSTSVGLLSSKLGVDGPLDRHGSTYLLAGRVSYLNLFIKAIPKYSSNSLRFYDVNARLNFRLSENDQLYLSLFRGYDLVEVEKMMNMSWSNTTGSLGWLHSKSQRHNAFTQLVASNYDTDQGMDVYSIDMSMQGYNRQLTLRHQQTWVIHGHSLNVGGESTWAGVQSAAWRVVTNREREKRDGWFASLWVSDDMSLFNDRMVVSAGLRMEWFSVRGGKPYYKLEKESSGATCIMWSPRWSFDGKIAGSHFTEYKDDFIALSKKFGDKVKLIFRPHPDLFNELMRKKLMSREKIMAYDETLKAHNIHRQTTLAGMFDSIRPVDIFITDYSSIMCPLFLTGRPIIYCEYAGATPLPEYEEMFAALYVAHSKDVEKYLEELMNGNDPLFERRQEILEKIYDVHKDATKKIVERVVEDFNQSIRD